jgi:ribosomal protein S3
MSRFIASGISGVSVKISGKPVIQRIARRDYLLTDRGPARGDSGVGAARLSRAEGTRTGEGGR